MANEQGDNVKQFPVSMEIAEAHWAMLYVEDADFRADFDVDPRATLKHLTGEDIPDDVEIVVHRRKPGQIHLVLPEAVDADGGLSAEQLGQVAAATGCYRTSPGGYSSSYRPVYDKNGRPW